MLTAASEKEGRKEGKSERTDDNRTLFQIRSYVIIVCGSELYIYSCARIHSQRITHSYHSFCSFFGGKSTTSYIRFA